MEAAEAKVLKVLERSQQFMVPHYQRPYSWGEREWDVLWRDIVELAADEGAQPHFMGSIVTAPGRSMPEGVEKRLPSMASNASPRSSCCSRSSASAPRDWLDQLKRRRLWWGR